MKCQVFLRLDPSRLAQPDFSMPILEHLLAKGSVTKDTNVLESLLCECFGLQRQLDWPAAALSWLGEGNAPGDYFWLFADPVNLQLQRDHFSINLPAPVPMTSSEAAALVASLNAHFAEDGGQFFVAASGQWYARLPYPLAVKTSWLAQAVNRDIRDFLPSGTAAENLHKLANEIQMLLHEHPVNKAREEQNLPVINSLWFSGTGLIPLAASTPPKTVFSEYPLAKGLASWAGRDALPLPADLLFPAEDAMLVMDNAAQDETWLEQLLAALGKRKIRQLTLDVFAADRHLHAELKPSDLWKFWRKPQALEAYFTW